MKCENTCFQILNANLQDVVPSVLCLLGFYFYYFVAFSYHVIPLPFRKKAFLLML